MEKRIEISDRTLKLLERYSDEFAASPRSRTALANAIETAVDSAVQCDDKGVCFTEPQLRMIDDMIHFGLFENKEALVDAALKLLEAQKRDEIKQIVSERFGV